MSAFSQHICHVYNRLKRNIDERSQPYLWMSEKKEDKFKRGTHICTDAKPNCTDAKPNWLAHVEEC